MRTISWSDFIASFTNNPILAVRNIVGIMADNFVDHWWRIVLIFLFFWLMNKILTKVLDFFIPKNINRKQDHHFPFSGKFKPKKSVKWLQPFAAKRDREKRVKQRTRSTVDLIMSILNPILFIISFFMVFAQLGVTLTKTTGTLVIGAVTLAFGLGMQDLIKDIIAGFTIITGDIYAVGDFIDMKEGTIGVVKAMGLRNVILESPDGTIWYARYSQIPQVGNITSTEGVLGTDITLKWNKENYHVTKTDIQEVDKKILTIMKSLDNALKNVDKFTKGDINVPLKTVAEITDDLTGKATDTIQQKIVDIKNDESNSGPSLMPAKTVINQVSEKIANRVPVFKSVEALGYVGTTVNSVTLRYRIVLPPHSSPSQALKVLRKNIVEEFIDKGISTTFEEVPGSDMPPLLPS